MDNRQWLVADVFTDDLERGMAEYFATVRAAPRLRRDPRWRFLKRFDDVRKEYGGPGMMRAIVKTVDLPPS